jgi:uncharacterized protein (TIGR03435 family)
MSRLLTLVGCLAFATGAFAQSGPAFDVASIRPFTQGADPLAVAAGLRITGSQVRIVGLSLRDYVGMAYRLPPSQVVAPEWAALERFDITGNLPAAAARDQVPDMIRALIEDRFQLKVHREQREFPVYALTVDKGGTKLKESTDAAAPDAAAITVTGSGSAAGVNLDLGNGTSFSLANNRIEAHKITMAQLAETLTRFTDRPVQDATALSGRYDIAVELTPEDYQATLLRSAVNAGVVLPPQIVRLLDTGPSNPLGSAIQKTGLTFESRKSPLDVVIVDSASKTPTEN